jgi:RNA polymerase sigma-70 factor (ECF subfamily)
MDSAIGDLILKRLPNMRAYAQSLTRNRAAAEDLVQDTIVRILTSSNQFDGSNFVSWSNMILRNRFIDDCRRARFRDGGSIDDVPVTAIAQKAAQELAVELDETLRALEDLSPNFRNILVLKCIDDLSYAHTARRLKITLGTVRSRLSRARAELSATVKGNRGGRHDGEVPTIRCRRCSEGQRGPMANRATKILSANAGPDERLAQQRHEDVGAHA